MKLITILIPAHNEEEVLPQLFTRLNKLADDNPKYNWEFLLVNDGSRDKTLEIIKTEAEKNSRVSYINLSRQYGKEIGMMAGVDNARGDAMVIIDADLQDPPELIPDMIKYWEEGYDDVYARRLSRPGETWLKKLTSWGYYRVLQRSTLVPIQRDTGDFRLFDRRCIDAIKQVREQQRNSKAIFSWIGFRKKEIVYNREPRAAGTTSWNYPMLINFAIDGITSFTTAPLRFASLSGFAISFVAFIYIIVVILQTIFGENHISGMPALICIVLFLGGIQLISLGIIGEYVGRIFNETKNRPLYFIEEYHVGKTTKTGRQPKA